VKYLFHHIDRVAIQDISQSTDFTEGKLHKETIVVSFILT